VLDHPAVLVIAASVLAVIVVVTGATTHAQAAPVLVTGNPGIEPPD
jgi:hypothetical protein